MIGIFVASFLLAAVLAAAVFAYYALATTRTIYSVTYWARVPRWIFWTGIPVALLGLIITGAELTGGKALGKSYGFPVAIFGLAWILGGWAGGAASAGILEWLAGWTPGVVQKVANQAQEAAG